VCCAVANGCSAFTNEPACHLCGFESAEASVIDPATGFDNCYTVSLASFCARAGSRKYVVPKVLGWFSLFSTGCFKRMSQASLPVEVGRASSMAEEHYLPTFRCAGRSHAGRCHKAQKPIRTMCSM
jgi:hypothetical protein